MIILSKDSFFTAGLKALCESNEALFNSDNLVFDPGIENIYIFLKPYLTHNADSLTLFYRHPKIVLPRYVHTHLFSEAMLKNTSLHTDKSSLTRREITILRLLSSGVSLPHITELLRIKNKTVYSHKKHAMQKLRIKNFRTLIMTLNQWRELYNAHTS